MAAPIITSINGGNPANINSEILIEGSNFGDNPTINFGEVGTPKGSFKVNATGTEIRVSLTPTIVQLPLPKTVGVQIIVAGELPSNTVSLTVVNPTKIESVSTKTPLIGNRLNLSGKMFNGAIAVAIADKTITRDNFTMEELGNFISLKVPQMDAGTKFPFSTTVTVNMPNGVTSNSYDITLENPTVVNTITLQNNSGLDTTKYTVWVAGFIEEQLAGTKTQFLYLQTDGSFKAIASATTAPFINVDTLETLSIPNVESAGNNRLVFLITDISTSPDPYSPKTPYAAYPFKNQPVPCPPGPYDIFEFGPIAQYDVSAVDSFGLNLSFTVKDDPLTYGVVPEVSREEIATAYKTFCENDPLGQKGFKKLLYPASPDNQYTTLIEKQFAAIVSPKCWLAIYPDDNDLSTYWDDTIADFFAEGNKLNIDLNAANVGNYSGSSDGSKYTLNGPNDMQITIPASDFQGDQGFVQAVRAQNTGESDLAYKTFGQIEAAIFEAISRGVALDGVAKAGTTITENYSSDAWIKHENWFNTEPNNYNGNPRRYDAYAKFFHYGKFINSQGDEAFIFGENAAQEFGMAYGFSLDEDPNVGTWPDNMGVPAKTVYYVGFNQDVTLNLGPFLTPTT